MELPVFYIERNKKMAKDPTTDPNPLQNKMILLTQLKRYDQKIKQKINSSIIAGRGIILNWSTGAIEVNVDNSTIGFTEDGKLYVLDEGLKSITVSNQPSAGSTVAHYNKGVVQINFNDVLVGGNSKTLVGTIPKEYAPSAAVAGVVLNAGSSWIMSAYSKVEPDGSIYVNPIYSNAAGLGWTGTLTYLI